MTQGDFKGAFKGKRVFVTGHTGFKGSWLSLWLRQLGADVYGYSLAPPTVPSNFVVSHMKDVLAAHYEADIRDRDRLHAAMTHARPDVVFHLAAQPIVRESYAQPRETFDVNVIGTASVLDTVCALARPCVVIAITSDKCYENREQVWGYRECDPVGGYDPYSASKGATELLVASYRRSFFPPDRLAVHGVKLATARAGNVIGGGDWAKDRILADAARALSQGAAVAVRNPHAVRPWQHVLEPLSGYLTLAARMMESDDARLLSAWNFGPGLAGECDVAHLMDLFCKAWGGGTWQDCSTPDALHEAHILRLCIDKAYSELGWRPRWPLAESVTRSACWYKQYYAAPSRNMMDHCLGDILAYSSPLFDRS